MKIIMRNLKVPHVFIFLSGIILLCSILTYFVPSGSFDRTTRSYGKVTQSVVVPGSYKEIPKHYSLDAVIFGEKVEGKATPVSILGVFSAIPKGLKDSAVLIFYVFIIGAVFALIHHTGAISALLFVLIGRFGNQPKRLFLLIFLLLFSGASFMGIATETIPLIPMFLYLSKRMGYDRIFGIGLIAVPAFLGWSAGVTNPFTVQIAQMIAELPIGSGIGLRILLYIAYAGLGFYFLMRYGDRVKKDPSKSLMKEDTLDMTDYDLIEEQDLKRRHIIILFVFVISYAAILFAVQTIGWGLIEMSAGFIAITILVTLIAGMSGDESMNALVKGLQTMIVPALVVGVARGISVVLQEGMIIDTILQSASSTLASFPQLVAAEGMLFFQSTLNFFIPSASGQALVSMPLMTPLADILGISRQTTVLAYILGDGLSNLIIPTNGVLMAMLGIAKVPFEKWFKFVFPMFVFSILIAMGFMALAIVTGY
jgi:uncharacterized ion transporter superfamily protein YfcC